MNKFIEIIEKITGKKVEISMPSLFWKLVERGPIKFIKAKRRSYVSTNDLDVDGKLRPDHLKHREQRKKKRNEPKSYGWVD